MTAITSDSITLSGIKIIVQDNVLYAQGGSGPLERITLSPDQESLLSLTPSDPVVRRDTAVDYEVSGLRTVDWIRLTSGFDTRCLFRVDASGNPVVVSPANPVVTATSARIFTDPQGNYWVQNVGALPGTSLADRRYLVRLTPDFSVDLANSPPPFYGAMYTTIGQISIEPDGRFILPYRPGVFADETRSCPGYLVKYDLAMNHDPEFLPALNNYVNAVRRLSDGRYLIIGQFTTVNTVNRNRIAILNPDGSLDNSFNPGTGFSGIVHDVVVLPDGRFMVYTNTSTVTYNGASRKHFFLINQDGSLDAALNVGSLLPLYNEANGHKGTIQRDGSIIITGDSTISIPGNSDRAFVIRLLPDGTFDPTIGFPASRISIVNTFSLSAPVYAARLANGNLVIYRKVSSSSQNRFVLDGITTGGVFMVSPDCTTLLYNYDITHNITDPKVNGFVEAEDGSFVSSGNIRLIGKSTTDISIGPQVREGVVYYLMVSTNLPTRLANFIGVIAEEGTALALPVSNEYSREALYRFQKIAGRIFIRRIATDLAG